MKRFSFVLVLAVLLTVAAGCQYRLFRGRGAQCGPTPPGPLSRLRLPRLRQPPLVAGCPGNCNGVGGVPGGEQIVEGVPIDGFAPDQFDPSDGQIVGRQIISDVPNGNGETVVTVPGPEFSSPPTP